jgi:hypothetical protein
VYLVLLLARLALAALFLVAAVSKLLGGFASSRKALTDFPPETDARGIPRTQTTEGT